MLASPDQTQIRVMASIGYVCLQWALLEHLLLGCIAAIENIPTEKTFVMFGSTDMIARCGIAINLARQANLPGIFPSRLDAIRKEIRGGLQDRRDQIVHGVHADAGVPDAVRLTIPKWHDPKRHQIVTVMEMHQLGTRLNELGTEALSIQTAIFEWRLRVLENRLNDSKREFAGRYQKALSRLTSYLKGAIDRLRGSRKI